LMAPVMGTPMSFSLTRYEKHFHLAANVDVGLIPEPAILDASILTTMQNTFGNDDVLPLRTSMK
jgi:hypothetical protein